VAPVSSLSTEKTIKQKKQRISTGVPGTKFHTHLLQHQSFTTFTNFPKLHCIQDRDDSFVCSRADFPHSMHFDILQHLLIHHKYMNDNHPNTTLYEKLMAPQYPCLSITTVESPDVCSRSIQLYSFH